MTEDLLLTIGRWTWVATYIACLVVSRRDKVCAMPLMALAGNFSWEVVHVPIAVASTGWTAQTVPFCLWLLLDFGIAWTYVRYEIGARPSTRGVGRLLKFAIVILLAVACQLAAVMMLGAAKAHTVMVFLVNLVMSAAFLALLRDRGAFGQSQFIAVGKMVGTLADTVLATIRFGWLSGIPLLGWGIAVLDISYVAGLAVSQRRAR